MSSKSARPRIAPWAPRRPGDEHVRAAAPLCKGSRLPRRPDTGAGPRAPPASCPGRRVACADRRHLVQAGGSSPACRARLAHATGQERCAQGPGPRARRRGTRPCARRARPLLAHNLAPCRGGQRGAASLCLSCLPSPWEAITRPHPAVQCTTCSWPCSAVRVLLTSSTVGLSTPTSILLHCVQC